MTKVWKRDKKAAIFAEKYLEGFGPEIGDLDNANDTITPNRVNVACLKSLKRFHCDPHCLTRSAKTGMISFVIIKNFSDPLPPQHFRGPSTAGRLRPLLNVFQLDNVLDRLAQRNNGKFSFGSRRLQNRLSS
jgi:hypothetical protein